MFISCNFAPPIAKTATPHGEETASFRLVAKMKQQHFLCMDVDFEGQADVIKEGESRKGILTFVNEDKFRFVESEPHKTPSAPTHRYQDLTGSLHGKISKNEHGVFLHMYVRHDDYQNARALADIFGSEVEQMCDVLADMNLKEEVAKCGK